MKFHLLLIVFLHGFFAYGIFALVNTNSRRSSGVERAIGNGEVDGSIPSGGTIQHYKSKIHIITHYSTTNLLPEFNYYF